MSKKGIVCAVAECPNSSSAKPELSYHRFPLDKKLKQAWIIKTYRKDKFNPDNSRICSRHFAAEDFHRDLRAELLVTRPMAMLKPGAIPSLFLKVTRKELTNIRRSERLQEKQRLEKEISLVEDPNEIIDNVEEMIDNVGETVQIQQLKKEIQDLKKEVDFLGNREPADRAPPITGASASEPSQEYQHGIVSDIAEEEQLPLLSRLCLRDGEAGDVEAGLGDRTSQARGGFQVSTAQVSSIQAPLTTVSGTSSPTPSKDTLISSHSGEM